MKKVMLILAAVFLASCTPNKKYTIDTGDGVFTTDTYTESNGCVIFKSDCGCGGEPQTIKACGNYIIKNNPNYEKVH